MKLQVTEEDIKQAYAVHLKPGHWWLDPTKTPIAIALRRQLSEAAGGVIPDDLDIRVNYDTILTSHTATDIPLPKKAQEYQIQFGLSLYKNLDPHRAAVIKKLHETSSSYFDCVEVGTKKADRVPSTEFDINI